MGRITRESCRACLKQNLLLLATICGVIIGIIFGVGMRSLPEDKQLDALDIVYLKFPGTMLLQGLKMVVLPLIIFSIISGIASLDSKTTGKLGGYAVAYYAITTLLAVIIGIIMSAGIKPGVSSNKDDVSASGPVGQLAPVDSLLDLVRNLIPANIVYATFAQLSTWRQVTAVSYDCTGVADATIDNTDGCAVSSTVFDLSKQVGFDKLDDCPYLDTSADYQAEYFANTSTVVECTYKLKKGYTEPRANILGVLFFSVSFAIALTKGTNPDQKKAVTLWFEGFNEAILKIVTLIIWYAPIGIIFLIAAEVLRMDDVVDTFGRLGKYMGTVLGGLAIHALISLPIVYTIGTCTRNWSLRAPLDFFKFVKGISQALLTAFATASSSATLPVTISNLEQNNNIDPRVSRFVLPIGATVNMDGTALYEAVAAIFIAQYEGLQLNFGDYVIISITATIASIGAAGIPQAGLVTLVIVMTAIGLPSDKIALILAIDWFLDRFRTAINVMGDSIGCAVVQANVTFEDIAQQASHDSELKARSNAVNNHSFEEGDQPNQSEATA